MTDVIVARYRFHPQQRLTVRPPVSGRQRPLMGQKQRTLHKEHRKRRQTYVIYSVLTVLAPALIGKTGAYYLQFQKQVFKDVHDSLESRIAFQWKRQSPPESTCRTPPHSPICDRDSIALRTAGI